MRSRHLSKKVRKNIGYLEPIDPSSFDPKLKIIKGSLAHCLYDIACSYGLNFQELSEYAELDKCGGFNEGYPVGSITKAEGQVLFSLSRTHGKSIVLEIGTFYGCSTNHLASAVAPEKRVYSIDIKEDPTKIGSLISPELKPYVHLMPGDLFILLPKIAENSIDLIFEDSAHLEETTWFCLEQAKRILVPGGFVIVHDTLCSTYVKGIQCRDRVLLGIKQAGMEEKFRHYIVEGSTYGIGICQVEK